MEIDIRDCSSSVDTIRFADDGVIKIIGVDTFEFTSDCNVFPFGLNEIDDIIKALNKIREVI